jgi:hypothetical protein
MKDSFMHRKTSIEISSSDKRVLALLQTSFPWELMRSTKLSAFSAPNGASKQLAILGRNP